HDAELDFEILRLAGAFGEEEADADFPRLAVFAGPVGEADGAVGGMVAEDPLGHDVGQPPGTDLDAVLVAEGEEAAEAGLEFARGPGEGAVRLEFAAGGAELDIPEI